ncbi:MAG: hypothetical protein J2P25_09305 [Nocardiopsaceae bacterium]|nr:hypothetical protein [Nocardiopsaceae bacterium]
MTITSKRDLIPRYTGSIPWYLRRRFLFALNAACFALAWWTGRIELGRELRYSNDCGRVVGMPWPFAVATVAVFTVAGASILLTIAWTPWKRATGGRGDSTFFSALALIVFALFNIVALALSDPTYMQFQVTCTGP